MISATKAQEYDRQINQDHTIGLNNCDNVMGDNSFFLNRMKVSSDIRRSNNPLDQAQNIKGYDAQGNKILINQEAIQSGFLSDQGENYQLVGNQKKSVNRMFDRQFVNQATILNQGYNPHINQMRPSDPRGENLAEKEQLKTSYQSSNTRENGFPSYQPFINPGSNNNPGQNQGLNNAPNNQLPIPLQTCPFCASTKNLPFLPDGGSVLICQDCRKTFNNILFNPNAPQNTTSPWLSDQLKQQNFSPNPRKPKSSGQLNPLQGAQVVSGPQQSPNMLPVMQQGQPGQQGMSGQQEGFVSQQQGFANQQQGFANQQQGFANQQQGGALPSAFNAQPLQMPLLNGQQMTAQQLAAWQLSQQNGNYQLLQQGYSQMPNQSQQGQRGQRSQRSQQGQMAQASEQNNPSLQQFITQQLAIQSPGMLQQQQQQMQQQMQQQLQQQQQQILLQQHQLQQLQMQKQMQQVGQGGPGGMIKTAPKQFAPMVGMRGEGNYKQQQDAQASSLPVSQGGGHNPYADHANDQLNAYRSKFAMDRRDT